MIDERELVEAFLQASRLAHLDLSARDVKPETLPAPHRRPSRLPPSQQVVYAFLLDDRCLKVGKAGPNTQARFISQHYGFNAPSTLAKTILAHPGEVARLVPEPRRPEIASLSQDSVGSWIERHTSRLHVFLPNAAGPFALSLLEAFMQCRLQPLFEGKLAPAGAV